MVVSILLSVELKELWELVPLQKRTMSGFLNKTILLLLLYCVFVIYLRIQSVKHV